MVWSEEVQRQVGQIQPVIELKKSPSGGSGGVQLGGTSGRRIWTALTADL